MPTPATLDDDAHYLALPARDVALQHAIGVRNAPSPAKALESAFAMFAPWRSYAVVRTWHTLAHPGAPTP